MVMIRNYRGDPKWLTGIILTRCAPREVKTDLGLIWRLHIDQLCAASPGSTNSPKNTEGLIDVSPIVKDHTDMDNLVPNSVHPANSMQTP